MFWTAETGDGSPKPTASLCASCDPPGPCALVADRERPVLYCEECEDPVAPPLYASQEPPTFEFPETNGFRGLCVSCQRREQCTYPMPEGGVWHCEEFE